MSTLNVALGATLTKKKKISVDLVRRGCIERFIFEPLPSHDLLQRRDGVDRAMATRRRRHLPALAPRPLQRRRLTAVPDRRTLQREPLHRVTSTTIPNPLPPVRAKPARPPTNRLEQPHPIHHAPSPGRTPPPPPPTRLHWRPPCRSQQALNRRDHPGTKSHARPGSIAPRPRQNLPAAHARAGGRVDIERRARRLACSQRIESARSSGNRTRPRVPACASTTAK